MKESTLILVRNRNAGSTGYTLNDGTYTKFEYGETKKLPLSQLQSLMYAPGGQYILENCLVIEDQSALDYLNLKVEPEYYYTEEDVRKVLLEGSLDQLEDTLNFAPNGVIELIKKIAIEEEIPDIRKRDLISKKTGFNITTAINIKHLSNEEETTEEAPKRKTTPVNSAPRRKVAAPELSPAQKYKVIQKG